MSEMKYPWRDGPLTLPEHLDFYKLSEAYKGDRSSYRMDISLEGFVKYLEPYLGTIATAQTVEIEGQQEMDV